MGKEKDTSKLWGGRFSEATDAFVQRFTASVGFDRRLAGEDIAGSLAHARMLCSVGVLNAQELEAIEQGLEQVGREIEAGVEFARNSASPRPEESLSLMYATPYPQIPAGGWMA